MTVPTPAQLTQNGLLTVLTTADRERLTPHMMTLPMAADDVLVSAGEWVVDTWFPCAGALAAFCVTSSEGRSVDVGFVGREGAVGGIVSNGQLPAYATAIVRVPGLFLRIKTIALEQMKLESLALRHWFSRYSDCLLAQVFQTSACNATHTIRQRVAKLILSGLARSGESEFAMTQEQLASMLGVGRTFISRVMGPLREAHIIDTRRGFIVVRNASALRSLSCTCTAAIENHFDQVLHGIYPPPP